MQNSITIAEWHRDRSEKLLVVRHELQVLETYSPLLQLRIAVKLIAPK
jgi:hypothetical protein